MAFKSYYKLVKYKDPKKVPFYLEDVSGSANTISLTKNNSSAPALTIETSTDGQTWTTLGQTSTTTLNISVPANSKVYVRCSASQWGKLNYNAYYNYFNSATGNFKAGGNSMSLLYGSNFTGAETTFPDATKTYILYGLFYNNTYLTDASDLILPSTDLTTSCYSNMFYGCSSLITPPALNALNLATYCYSNMFQNCSSLTQPPALPATGTIPTGSYSAMFRNCSSLAQAPALNASSVVDYSYQYMFAGCTLINSVTCLASSWHYNSTTNWLDGVAATGTFTKSYYASSWPTGASGIPSGWTIQDAQ